MPTFLDALEGDLGPARRHITRLRTGILPPSDAVLEEIEASLDRCIARMRATVPALAAAQAWLEAYVVWHGSAHDDDCPSDDTCGCSKKSLNEGVNAALAYLAYLQADGPRG